MRLYLLILCLFSIEKTFSQIDILETKEKEYPKPPNYDSTYNSGSFVSIMRLTGQTIYFIPHSKKYKEKINKYSESSEFLTKKGTKLKNPEQYAREDSISTNTYLPIYLKYNYVTPLDSIEGKYFTIKSIIENPKLEDRFRHDGTYLELFSKINKGDSLLFRLDPRGSKSPDYILLGHSNSYLIQGYYEKLKNQFITPISQATLKNKPQFCT